jgi:cell wall-associated NlpC family hydrolase
MMDYYSWPKRPMTAQEGRQCAREAEAWLLTPWVHRGAVKGACVDCGNLLIEIYSAAGLIPKLDPIGYSRDWMMHNDSSRFLEYVERFCEPTKLPEPGDVALFKFGRCISHGAIMLDYPAMIHAYAPAKCVTRDTLESPISSRLARHDAC